MSGDGPHSHPYLEEGLAQVDTGLGSVRDRVDALEAPPEPLPPTLFGTTTYPPRAPRTTESQEFAYLREALGRPIDARYSFSTPSTGIPASYSTSPMRFDTDRLPIWSFKPDPVAAAAGGLNAEFDAFLATFPDDDRDRRVIVYQEPVAKMPPETYRGMFTQLWSVAQDHPRVLLGVNLSAWDFDTVSRDPTAARGDEYIPDAADFVGLSLFANNADPAVIRQSVIRAGQIVQQRGHRFALSSVGVSAAQTAAKVQDWITWLIGFARDRRAAGDPLDHFTCYSSNKSPTGWTVNTWWMDGTPAILRAWRDVYDLTRHG